MRSHAPCSLCAVIAGMALFFEQVWSFFREVRRTGLVENSLFHRCRKHGTPVGGSLEVRRALLGDCGDIRGIGDVAASPRGPYPGFV